MRSKSLLHVSLLMLRASAALALTITPFHLSFDGGLPKLAATVAMADDDGGSEANDGDSDDGDSNDGDTNDHDDGDANNSDDGDSDDDSAEVDQNDDSTVASAIVKLFK
ncbi:hypothetical protein ACHMW7_15730 [Aminobacter sp. UC22_36]|uniref:hypothetical protein n=1 Tax=Aminobacter sp. UC22_36 TaxID=3374549 RepID=UPI0037583D9E